MVLSLNDRGDGCCYWLVEATTVMRPPRHAEPPATGRAIGPVCVCVSAPATGDDAPVGATKVTVAQSVADRVDRAVDVAEPVTCQQHHRYRSYS